MLGVTQQLKIGRCASFDADAVSRGECLEGFERAFGTTPGEAAANEAILLDWIPSPITCRDPRAWKSSLT